MFPRKPKMNFPYVKAFESYRITNRHTDRQTNVIENIIMPRNNSV